MASMIAICLAVSDLGALDLYVLRTGQRLPHLHQIAGWRVLTASQHQGHGLNRDRKANARRNVAGAPPREQRSHDCGIFALAYQHDRDSADQYLLAVFAKSVAVARH